MGSEEQPTLLRLAAASVDLCFEDVTWTVKRGLFKKHTKTILDGVTGEFRHGELTAIMGPSGAGKSALLNILTGYIPDWRGSIKVNGQEREINKFKKQSCYIMQDCHLQPLLTIDEAMHVAANLKLNSEMSAIEKNNRIDMILDSIGLSGKKRQTRTKNLSGGEIKRLAIALELLSNPPVMFFDEPTSGLDSSTTKQCIGLLQTLAREGRTIICTIHQPSSLILEMFDHLYTITGGKCIYQGSIRDLVPYLREINLNCPNYHNPSDFLLELSAGDYGDNLEKLVEKAENGKYSNNCRRKKDNETNDSIENSDVKGNALIPASTPSSESPKTGCEIQQKACCRRKSQYPASFLSQVGILISRNVKILSRNQTLTHMRFFAHVIIGLLIGTFYYQNGSKAQYLNNNFNFLYFTVIFVMFVTFNTMTLSFPWELPIIRSEHFNQWYSLKAYYIASTVCDAPIQFVSTIAYTIITYLMTEQPMEMFRYSYFVLVCILIASASQALGIMNGAIFSMETAVAIGPFITIPWILFSGFFIHQKDANQFMQWLFHASYLKYGFDGIVSCILGYDRPKLDCTADYCHFKYPKRFLKEVDKEDVSYWYSMGILFMMCVVMRIVSYFLVQLRLKSSR